MARQGIDKGGQLAQPNPHLPLQLGIGQDTGYRIPLAHGKAQQQATQPEQPAVSSQRRQIEAAGILGIESPADPRLGHPLPQLVKGTLFQLEAAQHGRHLEDGQQLGRPQTGVGQTQQGEQGKQYGVLLTGRAIRDGEGNEALGTKHRLNGRAVGVHIRHHHHHILGRQSRIGIKEGQQSVMQHLDLAHGAMAGMDLQRTIRGGNRLFLPTT